VKTSDRIKAIREGGFVKRCHTKFMHREYTVGQHSFNMLALLMVFHPNPSTNLIKAVVLHDVPERWTGDLPTPVKYLAPGMKAEINTFEKAILKQIHPEIELTAEETFWLKSVDMVELWQWCQEEQALGNTSVKAMKDECLAIIWRLDSDGVLPPELAGYVLSEKRHTFLSDMPNKVFDL